MRMSNKILVTGGAGFIGANFVLDWIEAGISAVVNLDKLTYAGNLENLATIQGHPQHSFIHGDIATAVVVEIPDHRAGQHLRTGVVSDDV